MLCQYIYMHTNTAVVLQTALPSLRRRNCFIPGQLDTAHQIERLVIMQNNDIKVEFGIILQPYPHKNGDAFIKKISNYTSWIYFIEDSTCLDWKHSMEFFITNPNPLQHLKKSKIVRGWNEKFILFWSKVCTTKEAGVNNVHHYQVRVFTDKSGQISLNRHGKLGCFSNLVITTVRNNLLLIAWSIWFCIPSCCR